MIAGLPFGTWALAALAVAPGIALVVAAHRVHRRGDARDSERCGDGGAPPQASKGRTAGRG